MKRAASLLLLVLLSLVEVHCQQIYPYVSFMGQPLANHSYVGISQVGTSDSSTVQCHTDLSKCCTTPQGIYCGDWYFPNGSRLPFSGDIYERRGAQRVDLYHISGAGTTGIYRCDIATRAVHSDSDYSVRDTVYVGLFTSNEGENFSDNHCLNSFHITGNVFISEIIYNPDQLTLTCISTGGPATTVTWTRDSTTVTEGAETVLDDLDADAEYTHTLTVTTGGEYTCTVENNKPSSDSATITVPSMYQSGGSYRGSII